MKVLLVGWWLIAACSAGRKFSSLGWVKAWGKDRHPMDSVYQLNFVFPHCTAELGLAIYSDCAENWLGECWGLASVTVELLPKPVAMSEAELQKTWWTLQTGKDASVHDALWR